VQHGRKPLRVRDEFLHTGAAEGEETEESAPNEW
jgi:hypothetical protein